MNSEPACLGVKGIIKQHMYKYDQLINLTTVYLCRPDMFERDLNLVLKLLKLLHAKWAQVFTKKISAEHQ